MGACTGIVGLFKELLWVTAHPQFWGVELRVPIGACPVDTTVDAILLAYICIQVCTAGLVQCYTLTVMFITMYMYKQERVCGRVLTISSMDKEGVFPESKETTANRV